MGTPPLWHINLNLKAMSILHPDLRFRGGIDTLWLEPCWRICPSQKAIELSHYSRRTLKATTKPFLSILTSLLGHLLELCCTQNILP